MKSLRTIQRVLRVQEAEGLAKLTLVLFDDEYLVPLQSVPVIEVLPLNSDTYIPRSMTALVDAVARTIDELGVRLAALPAAGRAAQVIVARLPRRLCR